MFRRLQLLCIPSALLAACSSFPAETGELAEMVPASGKIEVGLTAAGDISEIEFHVDPADLPVEIRAAARELLGELHGAEIEFEGGQRYYEASGRSATGLEVEAMFTTEGKLWSMEIQVTEGDVPRAVVQEAKAWRGGQVTAWEKIQDSRRYLAGWHVKKNVDGRRYKLIFDRDGRLQRVYRETPAEIEVVVE